MSKEYKVSCGKYVISHTNGANLKATRNGEAWRGLAGDSLILALVMEIEFLQERLTDLSVVRANDKAGK